MTIQKHSAINFKLRGESYKDAMLLLIAHSSDEDWRIGDKFSVRLRLIKKKVETIYEDYSLQLHEDASFDENKKCFDSLLEKYNDILFEHTTLEKPFKSLLLAERCSVWKKKREKIATLTTFTDKANDNLVSFEFLQYEIPCVDSEISQQDYEKIDSSTPPLWFQWLPGWLQHFIKKNRESIQDKSAPSSARWNSSQANTYRHTFTINGKETFACFRHATPVPVDLLEQTQLEEAFRITCLNLASQIRLSLDEQAKKSNPNEIQEAVILTQSLLSPGIAAIFKSRYISDSSDNDTQIYEMKEKAVACFQQALQNRHLPQHSDFLAQYGLEVQYNGNVKYKENFFNRITLVSTNHPQNILRRFGVHAEQNTRNKLNTLLLLDAVARYFSKLLSEKKASNRSSYNEQYLDCHARIERTLQLDRLECLINKLKHCVKERTLLNDRKALMETLGKLLSDEARKQFDENTLQLFDALQALLSIPAGQGSFEWEDTRHRQSLMSTAEAMIINKMDNATLWVACKSGKDRTGGLLAAYDTASVFYALSGRYPRHNEAESDRALYLKLYKTLFESGHHQNVASQNATGAEGLIKANLFLPGDIKLDAQAAQFETQLARLNKPKLMRKRSSKQIFNKRLLEKELKKLKDLGLVEKKDSKLIGMLSEWENYFILDKSIKELRNGQEFASQEELMRFIELHLFSEIEDDQLKKHYLALFQSAFQQGGFPQIFMSLTGEICAKAYSKHKIHYEVSDWKINFKPLKNGVQIEEVLIFNKRVDGNTNKTSFSGEQRNYLQADTCILVTIKDKKSPLITAINQVVVDCEAEELKPYFFKKTSLLKAVIAFFESLLAVFKRCWDSVLSFMSTTKKEGGLEDQGKLGNVAESGSKKMPSSAALLQVSPPVRSLIISSALKKVINLCPLSKPPFLANPKADLFFLTLPQLFFKPLSASSANDKAQPQHHNRLVSLGQKRSS